MRVRTNVIALLALLLLAAPATLAAAPASALGAYDIGALAAEAEATLDLDRNDAVVLLTSREIEILDDGRLATTVHTIVWLGSEYGVNAYADVAVMRNTETSTIEVLALRTWRDDTWWPAEAALSPTAIVETLPAEVQSADDYTALRRTMLLHDGVEIPCIVETAHRVVETREGVAGAESIWVFPQRDPALRSVFTLTVPPGARPLHAEANGAPGPEIATLDDGRTTLTWRMENLDPLPAPPLDDRAEAAAHVAWSTWPNWQALARATENAFEGGIELGDALRDTIRARVEHEPGGWAKAQAVAAFVDESTRPIRVSDRFWPLAPRPASRSWETAYGHRLDRSVLAAALFREAGCDARQVYRALVPGPVDATVPALDRFEGVSLLVSGDDFEGVYDPETGSLEAGRGALAGRTVWTPAAGGGPSAPDDPHAGSLRLSLTLELDGEGGWTGTGYVRATGALSPYAGMAGIASETAGHLSGVVASAMPGASLDDHAVLAFGPAEVTAGVTFALAEPEEDDFGRTPVVLGGAAGGVVDALPGDVALHAARREAPVRIAGPLEESVTFRIATGERERVRVPTPVKIENEVGAFRLTVDEDDDWITITRELSIGETVVGPDAWPSLRALLLEESDARSRTILLK